MLVSFRCVCQDISVYMMLMNESVCVCVLVILTCGVFASVNGCVQVVRVFICVVLLVDLCQR